MSGRRAKIAIVDYGMGNLTSVSNALGVLDYTPIVSSATQELDEADAYILPGVGAFPLAMKNLRERDLTGVLDENVMNRKKPILGICLGMQLMANTSSELGVHEGLGWIDADVIQIPPGSGTKVPHVGWSDIRIAKDDLLFKNFGPTAHFYFDHSYHFRCKSGPVAAECTYGGEMVAAIQQDNICATQFHPEKSQTTGLRMLRNFLNFADAVKCSSNE